jgi:sulfite dehydrogenase (quinone) subunit SoeA
MVAYADLVLPDTTYLERHDCISLLDRPISEPDAMSRTRSAGRCSNPTATCGRSSRCCSISARGSAAGFVNERRAPLYRDYADYIERHERRPGVGPLAGFRGPDGTEAGRGAPSPGQIERYIARTVGFWITHHIPSRSTVLQAREPRPIRSSRSAMGFFDTPQPVTFQLYNETLQKFRLSAAGLRQPVAPVSHRERILAAFDPLPSWYRPLEEAAIDRAAYPIHAITQRPAAMYHSWGSMNPWLRQIHTRNPLYVPGAICDSLGLADGDWVWVISPHGRIKVEMARMEAVNGSTVWTWNAIGKRKGAWALDGDVPEAKKGFLLNHLIHELLPPRGDGMRWSNSDPVTGQAAWYDLKVRIERVGDGAG